MIDKIRRFPLFLRVLILIALTLSWFYLLSFTEPDANAIQQGRNQHDYWLLSTFVIAGFCAILFTRKK
jgi:uncharacterized RDD family membrane protein YckC